MVSVVLPTRGDSAHLRRALASALAAGVPLEVLLVHDRRAGDPALPAEIAADRRVRLLEAERPGLPGARNTAIAAARGMLLALLDDDDLWLPGHLESAARRLTRDPRASLYTSDAYYLDDPTPDGSAPLPGDPSTLPRFRPDLGGALDLRTLFLANPIVASAVVLARAHLPSERPFDGDLPSHEDYDLWLRLGRTRMLLFDPRPGVVIRRRRGAMSRHWRTMAQSALDVLGRFLAEGIPEGTIATAEIRRRLGGLWHDLAYASLVEDDAPAARAAARRAIARRPLRGGTYAYLAASFLPAPVRRLAFRRGRRTLERGQGIRPGDRL